MKKNHELERDAELARQRLAGRICPVCFEPGLKPAAEPVFPDESSFELTVSCRCGAGFTVTGNVHYRNRDLRLSVDSAVMPGWTYCLRCSFPYGPGESVELYEYDDYRGCPVCRSPGDEPSSSSPAGNENSINCCPVCRQTLEIRPYQTFTEFRDGMTGDYYRTTKDCLAHCQACETFCFVQIQEDDKFGPVTSLKRRYTMSRDNAYRLIYFYTLEFSST